MDRPGCARMTGRSSTGLRGAQSAAGPTRADKDFWSFRPLAVVSPPLRNDEAGPARPSTGSSSPRSSIAV